MIIKESHLPRTESFIDNNDKKRVFEFSLLGKSGERGYRVTAREVSDKESGYIFVETSPSLSNCLDRLRIKIKLRLAINSQVAPSSVPRREPSPSQNILSGTIANDGIVIDGKLIDWNMLVSIITPHEGLKMNISILDPAG